MRAAGRQAILHAEMEFFAGGGEAGSMPTLTLPPYGIKVPAAVTQAYGYGTVWAGMPVASSLAAGPALGLAMPQSVERRPSTQGPGMTGRKFVLYTCEVALYAVGQGDPQTGSVASDAVWQFYGWVDAISTMIRGGSPGVAAAKELITPSYQTGGDVTVWGEDFTFTEVAVPMGQQMLLTGRWQIQCEEQVTA